MAAPLIDPNYLNHQRDLQRLMLGVMMFKIIAQPALAMHNKSEQNPGPNGQTDEELEAWVRQNAGTAYHPVGSCKTGPASDALAVVDGACVCTALRGCE